MHSVSKRARRDERAVGKQLTVVLRRVAEGMRANVVSPAHSRSRRRAGSGYTTGRAKACSVVVEMLTCVNCCGSCSDCSSGCDQEGNKSARQLSVPTFGACARSLTPRITLGLRGGNREEATLLTCSRSPGEERLPASTGGSSSRRCSRVGGRRSSNRGCSGFQCRGQYTLTFE